MNERRYNERWSDSEYSWILPRSQARQPGSDRSTEKMHIRPVVHPRGKCENVRADSSTVF